MKSGNTKCKICGSLSEPFASARILNKHDITYYGCTECEFVQTEEPYWLAESYAEAINTTDIGYVSRNLSLAKSTASLVGGLLGAGGRFLDYGGGYGLFVRLMRDQGLDWYWDDMHCANLFAKGFEADRDSKFDMVTCFEVMEHTVDPIKEIENMLARAPVIAFTTCILPTARPKPSEWWYYGLDHGQHVALFSRKSLDVLADRFSLSLWSNGNDFHILSRQQLPARRVGLLLRPRIAMLVNYLRRRPSLLSSDFEYLKSLAQR